MDHDAPEREILNLLETMMIYRVSRRLLDRQFDKAADAVRSFGKAAADALPMDDWDDDVIAEIAGR